MKNLSPEEFNNFLAYIKAFTGCSQLFIVLSDGVQKNCSLYGVKPTKEVVEKFVKDALDKFPYFSPDQIRELENKMFGDFNKATTFPPITDPSKLLPPGRNTPSPFMDLL